MDYKIDPETAELEFLRLAEAYDIDVDTEHMSEEDLGDFEALKATVVRAIRRGHLVVEDDGSPRLNLLRPVELKGKTVTDLKFAEMEMSHLKAGDKFDGNVAKSIAVTAAMCGVSHPFIEALKMADAKVCNALSKLFLV